MADLPESQSLFDNYNSILRQRPWNRNRLYHYWWRFDA